MAQQRTWTMQPSNNSMFVKLVEDTIYSELSFDPNTKKINSVRWASYFIKSHSITEPFNSVEDAQTRVLAEYKRAVEFINVEANSI